jgi:hypothetical protein
MKNNVAAVIKVERNPSPTATFDRYKMQVAGPENRNSTESVGHTIAECVFNLNYSIVRILALEMYPIPEEISNEPTQEKPQARPSKRSS